MEVIRQITAVAAVLALLAAALWWLRQRGGAAIGLARRPGRRRLECLERLPLGPHHTLHLIRLGEATLLLASSPGGCTLVESQAAQPTSGSRETVMVSPR
jgi:flagellar biogenesis protein FliO